MRFDAIHLRILSLGVLLQPLYDHVVPRYDQGRHFFSAGFWERHAVFCNEAVCLAPWILGIAVAALVVVPLQILSRQSTPLPLLARRLLQGGVGAQLLMAASYLLANSDTNAALGFLYLCFPLTAVAMGLSLAGWTLLLVAKAVARFRRA